MKQYRISIYLFSIKFVYNKKNLIHIKNNKKDIQ